MDIDKDKLKENAEKLKEQGAELGKTVAWMAKSFFGSKDKSLPSLCEGLISQGTVGRIYAAEMLMTNIPPDYVTAIPYLLEALSDTEPKVAAKSATALGKLGKNAPIAIFGLKNCIDSALDENVSNAAQAALEKIGQNIAEGFPAAVEGLSSQSVFLRKYSAELIASLGLAARNAVPYLKEAVQDTDISVRVAAIKALSTMKQHAAPAASVIIERLSIDDSMEVKKEAISALVSIGTDTPGVKDALMSAASNYDKDLSEYTISNLGKIGADAVPILLNALKEGSVSKKRKAAQAMGDLGPAGKATIDVLTRYLTDEDVLLRGIAKQSIHKIKHS